MSPSAVEARYVDRPNRFVVRAALGRERVRAFLPNPGRLGELLRPGVPLRIVPRPRSGRRTGFDVLAARAGGEWVCLDTRLANRAVEVALAARRLPEFAPYATVWPEARFRDSRFDFKLEDPGRGWLEVKTCSLVVDGRALFPDAPTTRGARHLHHLADLAAQGEGAWVLFLVVRRARSFAPNDAADLAFGDALRAAARAGVGIAARRASLRGRALVVEDPLPIVL